MSPKAHHTESAHGIGDKTFDEIEDGGLASLTGVLSKDDIALFLPQSPALSTQHKWTRIARQ